MNEKTICIREINMHVEIQGGENLPVIVFLHGFTGSTTSWREITKLLKGNYQTIAVDLTGHGKSTIPEDIGRYSMDQQVEDLEELFTELSLDQFILVGYSMGGRIALAYTVRHPMRVSSLILESSSPGLKTEVEREERQAADRRLADRITRDGLPAFIDFWGNIPLFASQKTLSEEKQLAVRNERLSQSEIGLANSLRGIGTGSQASYWKSLGTVNLPVLLITGKLDTKFVNISREMQRDFPNVRHETIEHAGHAIHVEKPATFATMIEEHISELKNRGGSL
ncbi:2-succinyl-6-hydroxy-2,4-cyclohexadiene-1-carboxylate synthase [Sporosarcina sp. resist]|uniref:2-succinyl-6-hydroxy-2, 4-cyclohexadiene-1-carboxylate synthase n=1 Tax=Sporosarcina sp. resist TaxID=2762563 RepID=UPI00164ED924|nr:2-succinyl-6-hydroxy-2,4-cyclohexadiene-1-carboxylate synthase [Sporosarcina sp. resist]QNK89229.1 2-succinyl-6-hydroxy-2,4-cyclohexadiene-1-carboxylate synthase [Sporosarcina sp. resist]